MKILLDECVPYRLKYHLDKFKCKSVKEMGWSSLLNGDLMKAAGDEGFEIFLTIDKNLQHQQNIKKYPLAIVVFDIPRSKIEFLKELIPQFITLSSEIKKGKLYILSKNKK